MPLVVESGRVGTGWDQGLRGPEAEFVACLLPNTGPILASILEL